MKHRIALLSNVNMNYLVRMLKKEMEVYEVAGYGNELGILMDPNSTYHEFSPAITFILMDLLELLGHDLTIYEEQNPYIDQWFSTLENGIEKNKIYYISDTVLWGSELKTWCFEEMKSMLEQQWLVALKGMMDKHPNIRIFPYSHLVRTLGEENSFSLKMWYMGKILHSNELQTRMARKITEIVCSTDKVAKKLLLLDLDNTLWGGIAGEAEHLALKLSEDHIGLAYKNLQRAIKLMKDTGVLLGIVSKNNEEDAWSVINHNKHMVLTKEDFVAYRINWKPKHENIIEIARELNIGLDSIVFFDDSEGERALVKQMLPEVIVPDFPKKPEELVSCMGEIYEKYFKKMVITKEDKEKTQLYLGNVKRKELEGGAASFETYLQQLEIVITQVDPKANLERLVQLVNKTNQFNLTTKRYETREMSQILENPYKRVYLYQVEDVFGDNGIVSAVIVDLKKVPVIEEFVMSCRVMGRAIEYAIVEHIEKDLLACGVKKVMGRYEKTLKNMPVEKLYDKLGYTLLQENKEIKEYEINLEQLPNRTYFVTWNLEKEAED